MTTRAQAALHAQRMAQILELAQRACGVRNADLRALMHVDCHDAQKLLESAKKRAALVRVAGNGTRYHYFATDCLAQAWLADSAAQAIAQDARVAKRHLLTTSARPFPPIEIRPPRHDTPAPPAGAPVITAATRITRHTRQTPTCGIDRMADPLPGVPGWRTGPTLRRGSLDYLAHTSHPPSHHAPATTHRAPNEPDAKHP
ncbi:MAG: hypothetical protein MUF16_00165 [Burkholderiaceae bacterium]|jgi:hypothetical protein|nr:hypothetical protein [Burkholderiaceae bacterium]